MGVVYRVRRLVWNEEKALKVPATSGAAGQQGLKGLMAGAGMDGQLRKVHVLLDQAIQQDPEYPLNYYNLAVRGCRR